MSNNQDPLFLPDEVKSFTKEGNLALMTEYTKQANEFKRKIEVETAEVEKWTRRVKVASTQPDAALREDAEAELEKHKRELLQAQMELAALEDRRTELRFQHNAPSTEQKFKTAQAQALVQQFQAIGVDPDAVRMDKELKKAEADEALAALKARAQATQNLNNISVQMKGGNVNVSIGGAKPAAASQPTGETTPGDLRRGAPLAQEMKIKGKLWKRIDALNIGDTAAEEAHQMTNEGNLSRNHLDSFFPNGRRLADDGVVFEGSLSFTLRGFNPGQDVFLLLRIDVAQKHEVETLIDGALVQTRPVEVNAQQRWLHETVLIPGAQVLMDDMVITRRAKEKTQSNLYAAWAFQVVEGA